MISIISTTRLAGTSPVAFMGIVRNCCDDVLDYCIAYDRSSKPSYSMRFLEECRGKLADIGNELLRRWGMCTEWREVVYMMGEVDARLEGGR